MNFAEKFKETLSSVLPIVAAVAILNFTVAPMGTKIFLRFLGGALLVIFGLTIFLAGVDMGISPMGERSGAALISKRNLPLLLFASFAIGLFITVAEPDVQVLVDQVRNSVGAWVGKWSLVFMIAIGVGLFITAGILRTILSIPLKPILFVCYVAVFLLAAFTQKDFQGIAFDSGGATTGPMTVPFIMALGLGVAAVRSNAKRGEKENSADESFGLTGIASIGPVAAVCLYGILFSGAKNSSLVVSNAEQHSFIVGIFFEVALALAPLAVMFFVFQIFLLKMPPMQVVKMVRGLFFSFVGLILFLSGAKSGFMQAGGVLGKNLGLLAATGFKGKLILYFVALIFGAIVVCAEPAVWVLTEQVENVSGGTIKRKMLLVSLSAGVALSIALSMARILHGFSIFCVLIPGYALAFLLMIFCPKLFTGIAFDSGGVASGPMASTFILSFALGVADGATGASSASAAFGVISLVAMTPLIAIQILGILFALKQRKKWREK